jgi:uncharacterized membrane protein YphA (DoxX/SURF4 family)
MDGWRRYYLVICCDGGADACSVFGVLRAGRWSACDDIALAWQVPRAWRGRIEQPAKRLLYYCAISRQGSGGLAVLIGGWAMLCMVVVLFWYLLTWWCLRVDDAVL